VSEVDDVLQETADALHHILQLLLAVLVKVLVTEFRIDILNAESDVASGIDLDASISVLFNIAWDTLVGLVLTIALPTLASAIGGGAVSSVVIAPLRLGVVGSNQLAAAITRATGGGARAAAATTNRAP